MNQDKLKLSPQIPLQNFYCIHAKSPMQAKSRIAQLSAWESYLKCKSQLMNDLSTIQLFSIFDLDIFQGYSIVFIDSGSESKNNVRYYE